MHRYKITYRKSTGLFTNTTWYCYVYDRENEAEYSGNGYTKKEAKDNALDLAYSCRNNGPSYSRSEPMTPGGKSNDFTANAFLFGGFGFFLALVVGLFKGCGLFHYDINDPSSLYLFSFGDAAKGFWILPVVGIIIGLFLALIQTLKTKKN